MALPFEPWGTRFTVAGEAVSAVPGDRFVTARWTSWSMNGPDFSAVGQDLLAQLLDPFGAAFPGTTRIARSFAAEPNPPVFPRLQNFDTLALADGTVLFTWDEVMPTSLNATAKGAIYDPVSGSVAGAFSYSLTPNSNLDRWNGHDAAELASGTLLVASSQQTDAGPQLVLRVTGYARGGGAGIATFTASTAATGDQSDPAIAALPGAFALAWTDESQRVDDASGTAVRARVFANDGNPQGAELLVNTSTAGRQENAAITPLAGGGFVVVWQAAGAAGTDAGDWDIRAQRFDAAGAKLGGEIAVNTITGGEQSNAAVLALPDGSWLVAWSYNDSWIEAQYFAADGTRIGDEFRIGVGARQAGSQPRLVLASDGRVLATWDSNTGGVDGQFLDNRPPSLYGGAAGDVILGHDAGQANPHDVLVGLAGGDTLYGLAGNDYLYSGEGSDLGVAGTGNDVLLGEAGNDTLYAGDGDDYVYGGSGTNVLVGEAGVDVLISQGTGDVLYGGDGGDYLYAYGSGSTVAVGDAGNDIFVMQSGTAVAQGGDGQDYFYLGAAADTMLGGAGVDVLIGQSTGGDTGAGDFFDGGAGTDYLFLTPGNDVVRFDLQSGVDVLNGFDPAHDVLRLEGTGFTSFDQVRAATTDYGSFCIVTIDAGTALWLVGVAAADLRPEAFVLA